MLNVDFVTFAKIAPATRARVVSLMADFEEFCRGVETGFKRQQLRYSKTLWAMIEDQKGIMIDRVGRALGNLAVEDLDALNAAVSAEIKRRNEARARVLRQREAQREADKAVFAALVQA